jgi:hypothetical protein
MTLARTSWWPQAERLDVGQRLRAQHTCGEGSPLILSRDEGGYRAWCFRCLEGDWVPPPAESLAQKTERLARQRAGDASLPSSCTLPQPQVYDLDEWPNEAKVWLYKAGFSRADIGGLRIFYHPPSDRVVIPVLSATGASFYQARAYQKGRVPKYLGPTPRPPTLVCRWGQYHAPCLTEDLLSAIKIGVSGLEGNALLGTRISDHLIGDLLRRKCRVQVVLDPDPPGQKGAQAICKQLRAYGIEHRNVVLPKDPKLLTRDQLRKELSWN